MATVHKEIYLESKSRVPSQKSRILDALRLAGKDGLTNTDLKDLAIRFSAVTNQLQLDGYDIELINEGNGVVRYVLHHPNPVRDKVKVKTGLEKTKDFFSKSEEPSFERFVQFLSDNGLHIKHKPNGIRK